MEDRFDGAGEPSRWPPGLRFSAPKRDGEAGSRLCQYSRGEFEAIGEESKGEEFSVSIGFLDRVRSLYYEYTQQLHTFVA